MNCLIMNVSVLSVTWPLIVLLNALSYFDGFKIAKVGQQFVRDVALSTVVQCIERCISPIQ